MSESRQPSFRIQQRVVCNMDLFNDGSHPEREPDALLVEAGTVGEIVNVGQHVESSTPVYMVEFPGLMIVGCLEEEISLAVLAVSGA
ncbi:MAG: nitrogen fixation protein NifZ [Sulfuricellaceae bacterium]|nr:nitrogen fixation protein NifZ [Sulfuricellaceae bacterium]